MTRWASLQMRLTAAVQAQVTGRSCACRGCGRHQNLTGRPSNERIAGSGYPPLRILYGVQTTGHGHLVRSTPLIQGLRARGHTVEVLLSGPPPAAHWLERIAPPRDTRPGLTFATRRGRIAYLATVGESRPLRFLKDTLTLDTRPYDLVVSDYEPITAWGARRQGVAAVGIGHLYAFAWPSVPRAPGNPLTHAVMDWFAPVAKPVGAHWSPFGAPLVPPFVAPEARAVQRTLVEEDLCLVYPGFESLPEVVALLRRFGSTRFRIYARVAEPCKEGNVEVRPVSREHFLADLARCRGVIANAGFTLASECLHLGIALLVKPVHGQLEQESNAVALDQLGLAATSRNLDAADVAAWLMQPPPAPQNYPDVTSALLDWLAAGAIEPLAELSRRLWQRCNGGKREPAPRQCTGRASP